MLSMFSYDFLKFYTETPKYTHAPGLSVMRELMHRLGDPQNTLSCVHIAGTNGKGSCAAMTASVFRAAGYRTGLFTSPDLTGLWERISIDGANIPIPALAEITQAVQAACNGLDEPSFFEKITAAAFLYFSQKKCDRVVLETGLGGRLDATNILPSPLCSVVMPIGFDHMAQLGSTLSAIAGEKAGIIKPDCPVVSASQPTEAMAVIRNACKKQGSPLLAVDITRLSLLDHTLAGQQFSYGGWQDVSISLLGAHQAQNACAVIELAAALNLPEQALRAGLQSARWPCRLEYFPGTPPLLLDGAHNAHGAAALAAGLRDYFPPGQRFTMLMGVMADKDYSAILEIMEPFAARFVCITPDSPRALPAETLAALITRIPAHCASSLPQALALAAESGDPICSFGSLYYIGQLRKQISRR